MRLAIFHYHLRPGGVTGVITEASIAIGRYLSEVDELTIVTGSPENTERVVDRIKREAPDLAVSVRVHPELGYVSQQNGVSLSRLQHQIEELLRDKYFDNDMVWWVHNYQLGKNPAFTAALIDLLEHNPEQQAILQIHDFPECARPENLRFLRSHVSGPVYPIIDNVVYATLNERDRRLLVDAGVPREAVYALPNPVSEKPRATTNARLDSRWAEWQRVDSRRAESHHELERPEVLERLQNAFAGDFPNFDPDGLLFLYPVRGIRRKNVLEAGFLTKLFNARDDGRAGDLRANLVVSLPGVSPLEKPYWDLVSAAYSDGTIPGMAGIGTKLEQSGLTFDDLMQSADLILSTSVQEGFGYAFFEAPMRGRPLLARYLDVLDGLDHFFDTPACSFYTELRVPFESPSIDSIRSILRIRYDEQLEHAAQHLPDSARKRLETEIDDLLSGPTIDFSFLMPQIQYSYIKDLADEAFAADIRALNLDVYGSMSRLVEEQAGAHRGGAGSSDGTAGGAGGGAGSSGGAFAAGTNAAGALGYGAYAKRIEKLLSGLEPAGAAPVLSSSEATSSSPERKQNHDVDKTDRVQLRLLEAFAHKDYFRLLYRPVGE